MATKTQGLTLELREKSGTTAARKFRSKGSIPGVLYGHGQPPLAIAVDAKALGDLLHGPRQNIVDVTLDGSKDTAIIRDMQRDPVSLRVTSIDLQRVSRSEVISAEVPIITVGTALGVREMGGVLDIVTHEIQVSGPADKIPEAIRVDVSELGIHQHITAGELALPEGFKLQTPPETTIVAVEPSKTEKEAEADLTQATPEPVAPAEGETPPAEGAASTT